jgi:hypothetical protein
LSGIERERAPKLSPASAGKRAVRGPAHDSLQISAAKLQKRIAELPDSFSSRRQHLGTDKHNVSAEKLQRRAAADQSIKETIAEHFDKQPNLVGATISPEVQACRYNVPDTSLCAGVAAARRPGCRKSRPTVITVGRHTAQRRPCACNCITPYVRLLYRARIEGGGQRVLTLSA